MYTDQENTWAAQMAYCNITPDIIEAIETEFNVDEPTFNQIVQYCNIYNKNIWYDDTSNNQHDFLTNATTSEYGNWKIVSVCDQNTEKGLYAMAIETGSYTRNNVNNGIILSVRGSEPTASQAFMDYVETDANFINTILPLRNRRCISILTVNYRI